MSGVNAGGRAWRGAVSNLGGLAAEAAVERHYLRSGHILVARRWRGGGGEIDLILRRDAELVFVEIKKSRSFAAAAVRLSARQIGRIVAAAAEFLAGKPAGLDTAMRFDVALVDGGGRIEIVENAFGTEPEQPAW